MKHIIQNNIDVVTVAKLLTPDGGRRSGGFTGTEPYGLLAWAQPTSAHGLIFVGPQHRVIKTGLYSWVISTY